MESIMPVLNLEIAAKFNELADLLEIQGENPFRIRAYRNAALLITNLPHEVTDLIVAGKNLTELPGIGKDLAEKITAIINTGELPALVQIKKQVPPVLAEMVHLPGLGPKHVKQLYDNFKIKSITDLKKVLASGKVEKLKGFGAKTVAKITESLAKYAVAEKRTKLAEAEKIVAVLTAYLQKAAGVKEVVAAGSFRRRKETVGDIDILATINQKIDLIDHFVKNPDVKKIISQGTTRATVILRSGMQIDLRVVDQSCFGAALQYFTGSKEHNIALRTIAVKKKLKINEYGVFKGKKIIAGKTETEVYRAVGLSYIEPELRENRGEIEAAFKNKLPELVTLEDLKGDLHCHSDWSADASDSIEDMVIAAKQMGLSYIAITDHSKHVTIAKGLDKKHILQQIKYIDKLNTNLKNFRILKSSECDILDDGSLDLPNEVLKELDLVVCSVHYKFNLSRNDQTARVLKAMENPYFNILAHPTGRLIGKREPYEIDLEKIMLAAKERNIFLELNSHPYRLDLNDVHCMMAKEIGVKISIATDSHSISGLSNMRYGIDQARRGWLEINDVINTKNLHDLIRLLKRK